MKWKRNTGFDRIEDRRGQGGGGGGLGGMLGGSGGGLPIPIPGGKAGGGIGGIVIAIVLFVRHQRRAGRGGGLSDCRASAAARSNPVAR